jgi:hypothetical protein
MAARRQSLPILRGVSEDDSYPTLGKAKRSASLLAKEGLPAAVLRVTKKVVWIARGISSP